MKGTEVVRAARRHSDSQTAQNLVAFDGSWATEAADTPVISLRRERASATQRKPAQLVQGQQGVGLR